MKKNLFFFLLTYFSIHSQSTENIDDYFQNPVGPTSSNYGITGVMEIPNARFMKEASILWNFSASFPNEFTSITATPFSWLEASYRYTEIKNARYGPSSYSGNQSLKDKGFDIKIKMLDESLTIPALAIGLTDIAGTGTFASEYLVATKRFNNFDFTLGLGWGILGTQGGVSSPLDFLDDSFQIRNASSGEGGTFSYKDWFSGNASFLSALEYDLKKVGLRLKLEYDTSQPDRRNRVSSVKSRFNLGFTYHLSNNLNISSSFERGEQFRIGFNLKGNFLEDSIKKPKPKNVVKLNRTQQERVKINKEIFYRSINRSLREEDIFIQAASLKEDSVDVAVASNRFYSMTRKIGRSTRIISALSPDEVKTINIHSMNGDFEVAIVSIDRDEFDSLKNYESSAAEIFQRSKINSNTDEPLYKNADFKPDISFPEYEWSMAPALKHQIGGPEGFYLGQLFWKTDTSIKFRRNLVLYNSFGINLYDTFNDFRNPSQSTIPKVRSDIQEYLKEGKNNIQRIQLQYFSSPINNLFLRLDLGILEEMFAGVGAEVLYRPFSRSSYFGASLHRVRQRGYEQRFSLRDYETTTGYVTHYWELPYGVNSKIHIGKYLAGDKGITWDLSRRFKSGATMGIFATKTNLSAEEFGEGSFNKGFYISVPTQMFYSDFRSGNISFGLTPLTKDGGAMLIQHNALFSILGDSNTASIERDWDYLLN